jgi:hypothetical protein
MIEYHTSTNANVLANTADCVGIIVRHRASVLFPANSTKPTHSSDSQLIGRDFPSH